jgi:hypothetical protein
VDVWIARTHSLICHPVVESGIDPSHPHLRGMVHRFARTTPQRRFPLKGNGSSRGT